MRWIIALETHCCINKLLQFAIFSLLRIRWTWFRRVFIAQMTPISLNMLMNYMFFRFHKHMMKRQLIGVRNMGRIVLVGSWLSPIVITDCGKVDQKRIEKSVRMRSHRSFELRERGVRKSRKSWEVSLHLPNNRLWLSWEQIVKNCDSRDNRLWVDERADEDM
jgi:hypothetical protein